MRIPSLLSLAGFVLIITGTYSPLLRPLGLFSWDMYELNKPYAITVLAVAVVGIIALLLNKPKIARLAAFISAILVVLLYIAAWLKVHTYFSFVPFKGIAAYLSAKIKFKWGWFVLAAGALLSLSCVFTRKPSNIYNKTA